MPLRRPGRLLTALFSGSLFAASIAYLVSRFEWREPLSILLGVDFLRLIGMVWAVQFVYICVRTWRWREAVRQVNAEVGFFDLYWITAVVVSLSIITPGQLGEALKIELLKRRGLLNRLPGLGAFALERLLDLLVVAGMAIAGLLLGGASAERYPRLGIAAALLFVVGLVAIYLLFRFDLGRLAPQWLAQVRTSGRSPVIWVRMACLTVVSWGLVGALWQIALRAVDVSLSLAEMLWLVSIVTLGMLLSLIPGGFGVAEVLTVEALMNMGVTSAAAQAGALILRAYGFILLLFGVTHLLLWLLFVRPSEGGLNDSA